ncbi:phosphoribosyltransferase family protein [Puia dinghuensis]|uniref:Bifunctional protein PyrR n=1 Tax=Puia dinghuensis TaxID=1792502 RepID=A0A8J2XR46_9BACT|nr:phosphoribosyltransferase family protein [Puia dinghuensis]GGA85474.1 bifunctional protein PyrR [Puia dinghuensis]
MKNYILTQQVAEKKLRRMAYEILENNAGEQQLILAGIRDNGSVIARTIQQHLQEIAGDRLSTRLISISLDKKRPGSVTLSESLPFDDQVIIIIDDVAMSGKTLLYAMKPFLDFHPRKIESLVLVERSHKAFPVQPDYMGLSLSTTLQEHIYVEVDGDTVKGAWLE